MTAPEDSTRKGSFQLGTAMGQPESISRGVVGRDDPLARLDFSLQLAAELADLGGEAHRVVVEADLVDEQHVPARDGSGDRGPEAVEPLQDLPPGVHQPDGFFQFVGGDGIAGDLLHPGHEAPHFRLPQVPVAGLLHLGDLHDIHRRIVGENFVGLFLAVAGSLPHHQVTGLDEGAQPGQFEAHEGFDQGTGVPGEDFLGRAGADLRPGAQPHAHRPRGQDHFLRHKDTEGADDFPPLGLGLLQFPDAQAMHLGEHEVQVFHALEAAFLGQVDIPVKFAQHLEQPFVGRQIQVQLFPHVVIRRRHHIPLVICM